MFLWWRKKKLVPRGVTDDQMPLLSTAAQTEPWPPYEAIRNHPADFRVKYRLYRPEEGGRKRPPRQGYRSDFAFDEDDLSHPKLYMIFPEFEDEQGRVILDCSYPIPFAGTARMWIVIPERRQEIHRDRIKVGTKGYFMEGPHRIGEMEVIELLGLHTNPVGDQK